MARTSSITGGLPLPHSWLGGGGAVGGLHGPMPFPHGFLKGGPPPTGGLAGPMPFPHGWLRSTAVPAAAITVMPLAPVDDSYFL